MARHSEGRRRGLGTLSGRLAAVLLLALSAGAAAGAATEAATEGEAQTAAAPALPQGCRQEGRVCVVPLPVQSPQRSQQLHDAAGLRILLELGYERLSEARLEDPGAVGCELELWGAPGVADVSVWRRSDGDGRARFLEMGLAEHPSGVWELWIVGSGSLEDVPAAPAAPAPAPAPKPDAARAAEIVLDLLQSTSEAPLGSPKDHWLTYQLSYIQADRALALLAEMGFSVVRYGVRERKDEKHFVDPQTVQDQFFDAIAAGPEPGERSPSLSRPVVVQLIDSEVTSLVQEPGDGGETDTTLQGGSRLTGVTSGVPEQRLFIVYHEDDVASVERLLNLLTEEIDVPARQILIEALVIELDRDRLRDLGVSFTGSRDGRSFSFDDPERGLPFVGTYTRPSPETLLELTVTIRALVDQGEAQVLSRPSVLVLDGRQARIKIADEIPYLRAKSTNATGGLTTEVQFLTAGIILNLRPRASQDGGDVTLQVETIISSAGSSGVTDEGLPITPVVQSREVQSFVRVANDTPFIIGGLISTTKGKTVTGIPGLSKIPWLGRLFRKENEVDDRKEVAVILTPHVIEVDDRDFSYVIPKDAELFDSFGNTLFRNIYRLRSSDVFDLAFIWENDQVLKLRQQVETTAQAVSRTGSTEVPAIERERVVAVLEDRLGESAPKVEGLTYVEEQKKGVVESFLQVLEGGVSGEEILVERMLAGVIGKRFEALIRQVRKIILFIDDGDCGIEVTRLEDVPSPPESCARAGEDCTLVLRFGERRACPGPVSRIFSPPVAVPAWEVIAEDDYRERLRLENQRGPDGRWTQQAILLRSQGETGRSLRDLRTVLLLKRLLDLNRGRDLLTLEAFRTGREVVFPTRDDLAERNHLIDRRAAQLFYEIEDYYRAFEREFERLKGELMMHVGAVVAP